MTSKKDFNFTNAFEELESIGKWFENEQFDIDTALEKYKRGSELVKLCRDHLKKAENELKKINPNAK